MDDIQNKPEEANPSQALIYLKHLHKELQTIQSISEPALKLRMFALANDLISAKNYFKKLREGLKTKLMHDIDRDVDYEEWGNPKKWQVGIAKVIWRKTDDSYGYIPDKNELQDVSELLNDNNYKELERVSDSVKDVEEPNPKDVIIQENLEEKISTITNAVKNGVEVFGSDVYFPIELLRNAIAKGLNDLVGELNNIHILLEKNSWQPTVLVNMYESLEKRFVNNKAFGKNDIEDEFERWKEDEEDNLNEDAYYSLLNNELMVLLSTDFCIGSDSHYNRKDADSFINEVDNSFIKEEEINQYKTQYFFLRRIIGFENNRYKFSNRQKVGKHIFTFRKQIPDKDIKAFFRFKKMCELIYKSLDKLKGIERQDFEEKICNLSKEKIASSGIEHNAELVLGYIDSIKDTIEGPSQWAPIYSCITTHDKIMYKGGIDGFVNIILPLFNININKGSFNTEVNRYADQDKSDKSNKRAKNKIELEENFNKYINDYFENKLKAYKS